MIVITTGFNRLRDRVAASCVFAGLVMSVAGCASAESIVVGNAALELRFDVGRGRHGHLTLTGIHDRAAGQEWLASPSPLFELSFDNVVFRSDDLPVSDVTANDTGLIVSGDLFSPPDIKKGHTYTVVVKLPQGEPAARVRGTFTSADDDWIGPFLLGDKGNRPAPVFAPDAYVASVRTDARSEEVFVVGFMRRWAAAGRTSRPDSGRP